MAAQPPENAFFEFFLREVSTAPPQALPIYPAGGSLPHPAHTERLHSIPDRPRLDDRTGCGVLDCLCNVSETEQIRTLERHTKTGLKIITFSCMFVACATLQIH